VGIPLKFGIYYIIKDLFVPKVYFRYDLNEGPISKPLKLFPYNLGCVNITEEL